MFGIKNLKGVGSLRHTGKEKIKVQYDIIIKKLVNFPELNGKKVALSWKRGSTLNTGTTKEVEVFNGECVWNEKLMVKSTLFRDPDTDKFDAKDITFSLKQDSKVVAKLTVDLGNYAKNEATYPAEFPFTKKVHSPTLQISVHTRWVKINGKLLVKPEEKPGPMVEIDGHAYGLKTDDALTDTSIDTGTGSWEEEDIDKDDPFTSTSMYEVESRRTHDEMEALRKQLRLVEGESSQRVKTIELQERELIELRRQLEILEKKCSENDELVQRGYNLESFMQQQIALARQESQDASAAVKLNHQNEILELRKQLETERTRAQLSSLDYSSPTPPIATIQMSPIPDLLTPPVPADLPQADPATQPDPAAASRILELESDNDGLRQKADSLMNELEQSAYSLINMTNKLSEKEHRIETLATQISLLQTQINTLTSSQAAETTTSLSPSSSFQSKSPTSRTHSKYKSPSNKYKQPIEPTVGGYVLDNPGVILLVFLVLLILKTIL